MQNHTKSQVYWPISNYLDCPKTKAVDLLDSASRQIFSSPEDRQLLSWGNQDNLRLANTLVENAVGYFQLPLSIAPGIMINDSSYPFIPLVTEETSVVAALSKNILFVNSRGILKASQTGRGFIGQIHFPRLKSPS